MAKRPYAQRGESARRGKRGYAADYTLSLGEPIYTGAWYRLQNGGKRKIAFLVVLILAAVALYVTAGLLDIRTGYALIPYACQPLPLYFLGKAAFVAAKGERLTRRQQDQFRRGRASAVALIVLALATLLLALLFPQGNPYFYWLQAALAAAGAAAFAVTRQFRVMLENTAQREAKYSEQSAEN